MAVQLEVIIKRYIGLSTDTKPATLGEADAGSTFYETDTGNAYVFDGAAWQLGPEGTQRRIARGNWNFTDDGGAQGAFTIFTITGDVLLQVFGVCDVAVTGVGTTIELGVAGNTAVLIAQATGADLIANEIWHDATPTTTIEQIDVGGTRMFVVTNGQDAILTIGGADATAGDIDFYALWTPLSPDGLVVAA